MYIYMHECIPMYEICNTLQKNSLDMKVSITYTHTRIRAHTNTHIISLHTIVYIKLAAYHRRS